MIFALNGFTTEESMDAKEFKLESVISLPRVAKNYKKKAA